MPKSLKGPWHYYLFLLLVLWPGILFVAFAIIFVFLLPRDWDNARGVVGLIGFVAGYGIASLYEFYLKHTGKLKKLIDQFEIR